MQDGLEIFPRLLISSARNATLSISAENLISKSRNEVALDCHLQQLKMAIKNLISTQLEQRQPPYCID
jgi:hypothetical protein